MKENHTRCAACKKEKFNGLFSPCTKICIACVSAIGKKYRVKDVTPRKNANWPYDWRTIKPHRAPWRDREVKPLGNLFPPGIL